jgi:hypothetical protein
MTRRALGLHLALCFGLAVSTAGTWVEWHRAGSGHEVAWGYAVEWPLIGAFCVYLWWRLLAEDRRTLLHPSEATRPNGLPRSTRTARIVRGGAVPADDPGLLAWNAHVAALHAADPPGGPPASRGVGRRRSGCEG